MRRLRAGLRGRVCCSTLDEPQSSTLRLLQCSPVNSCNAGISVIMVPIRLKSQKSFLFRVSMGNSKLSRVIIYVPGPFDEFGKDFSHFTASQLQD